MRILITGGGGLIGQAVARKHLKMGDDVFIYDKRLNLYNDYSNLVGEDITFSDGRIVDIYKVISEMNFDIISHHAARVGVGESQYNIVEYVRENVLFTAELLHALRFNKPKKLILAGSMSPYGDSPFGYKHVEEDNKNPQSIYGVTKLAQEELFRVFSVANNIPTISLRYFSVYGITQSPLNPYTGVLSVIGNLLLNEEKVELYDDGSQTRDLINVEDVAEAHFLATRYENKDIFEAFNIGTETSLPLSFIAGYMRDRISPQKEIIFNGKHRMGDILHSRADITKARELLGFTPKHDIINDMDAYCDYLLKNKERFKAHTVQQEQKRVEELGLIR
jgi:nucleoside-diphosphate-sugar epimerase